MVGYRENYFFFFYRPEKFSEGIILSCVWDFVFIIRPEINFSEGYCSELCRLGYVILFFYFYFTYSYS